jgi:hypothetical protein
MKTLLDTNAWSSALYEGNASFVQVGGSISPPVPGTLFVVSQVRPSDNSFVILKSDPVPPTPGPGWSFTEVAKYTFPELNESFDPVVAYDDSTGLLHIIGTQDNRGASDSTTQDFPVDLVKFTFDTVPSGSPLAYSLTGPTVLATASYVRDGYDICAIGGGYTFIGASLTKPQTIDLIDNSVQVTGISISAGVLTVETAYGSPPLGNFFPPGINVTLTGLQLATFLNGITVTITGSDYFHFTAALAHPDYTQTPGFYESGFATWLPGNAILGFTLEPGDVIATPPVVFASSPLRTGPVFGSVSTCFSGSDVEVYYESHPKNLTFQDQTFSVNLIVGTTSPPVWSAPTVLTTFTGRYTDNRLTVVPDGNTRTMCFVYYTQKTQVNSFIGNILLGHFDPSLSPPQWAFTTATGDTLQGSVLQAAVSIDQAHAASVSFILSPVYSQRGAWSYSDLTIKPVWQDSYAVNDTVEYGGDGFVCVAPMQNRGYWAEGSYNFNDIAAVPAYYAAVQPIAGNAEMPPPPQDAQNWVLFPSDRTPPSSTQPWNPRVSYATGAVVQVPVYYISQTSAVGVVSPQFDPVNWTLLQPPSETSFQWAITPVAWPLYSGALNLNSLSIENPQTYADLSLTWLRGTKTLLDSKTLWAVLGEASTGEDGSPPNSDVPYYVSFFNVPPTAKIVPTSGYVYRGTSFPLDASGTYDPDTGDTVAYTWSLVVPPADASFVTLTPNGNTASLFVYRAIGGAEVPLSVSVVAVDSTGAHVNHPPMVVSNIAYTFSTNTVSVTVDAASLAVGEKVLLYQIGTATFLGNAVVTVVTSSPTGYTGTVEFATPAQVRGTDYASAADTGFSIASPQFAVTLEASGSPPMGGLIVPFNPAPVITMPDITGIPRNSLVTVIPVITGDTDPDDSTTYAWVQTQGTPLQASGTDTPVLEFHTNGAEITGETIEWQLTVNDGVNPPVASTITMEVTSYDFMPTDTRLLSRSVWGSDIAGRNTYLPFSPPLSPPQSPPLWGPLDISGILTDLSNVKRVSILQIGSPLLYSGNDRYILISPYSVIVYREDLPSPVLRKLFLPSPGSSSPPAQPPLVVDAVHTEEDYTLVLGSDNNLYRFSEAPLIDTDNPDVILDLTPFSAMTFDRIFSTVSYSGSRVLALSGQDGCLLMQVKSDTIVPLATLEISLSSQLLYGASNVQFVRLSNVESIRTGQIFLGTIADDGTTYETLIDLSQNAIIGTWDRSKLINQDVTTGEIMFKPEDAYSGKPLSPALSPLSDNGPNPLMAGFELVGISWVQNRPDLASGYVIQSSTNGGLTWQVALTITSGAIENTVLSVAKGFTYIFRVQTNSADGDSGYSNIESIVI